MTYPSIDHVSLVSRRWVSVLQGPVAVVLPRFRDSSVVSAISAKGAGRMCCIGAWST